MNKNKTHHRTTVLQNKSYPKHTLQNKAAASRRTEKKYIKQAI